jgi:hypothetical protein
VVQSLLVGGIGFLQVIHHQVTVTQAAPGLTAGWIQLQDILEILDGLGELLLGAQDARDGVHGGDRPLVVAQSLFVRIHRTIEVTHQFSQATYKPHSQYAITMLSIPISSTAKLIHTNLKPHLLIEGGNLLSRGEGNSFLALCGNSGRSHVAIGLGMGSHGGSVVLGDPRGRGGLRMRHDGF